MRGACALLLVGLGFLLADAWERIVIAPLVRLRPARRNSILSQWARSIATWVLHVLERVGGARFDLRARIPARAGVLVLMNHQSLIDIPVAFKCLEGGHPRILTRKRYGRGIPLISHMLRLYGHPLVDPGRASREEIRVIAEAAARGENAFLVFPEGHRTRDGSIRRFQKAGLSRILAARRWEVYVLVVDGLRHCARWDDFVRNVEGVRARAESVGPFPSPEPEEAEPFLEEMRETMCRRLEEMRAAS